MKVEVLRESKIAMEIGAGGEERNYGEAWQGWSCINQGNA
jgi:hypothetical protein